MKHRPHFIRVDQKLIHYSLYLSRLFWPRPAKANHYSSSFNLTIDPQRPPRLLQLSGRPLLQNLLRPRNDKVLVFCRDYSPRLPHLKLHPITLNPAVVRRETPGQTAAESITAATNLHSFDVLNTVLGLSSATAADLPHILSVDLAELGSRTEDDEAHYSGCHAWDESQDAADCAGDRKVGTGFGCELGGGRGAGQGGVDYEDLESAICVGVSVVVDRNS